MTLIDYAKDIFNNPQRYAKFWLAVGGFGVNLVLEYFPDARWVQPFVALITATGVFYVKNDSTKTK